LYVALIPAMLKCIRDKAGRIMNSNETSPHEALLGQLIPINNLPNSLERRILQRARVIDMDKRQRISSHTENNWILYLLEGILRVATATGVETITAPSARSLRPVFSEHSVSEVALTQSECQLLKIDRQFYELLLKEQDDTGIEIQDVQINPMEGALLQSLYQAYAQQMLELPSMPEVALSLRKAMDDPVINAEQISRFIQLDPVITGGVIQAANSPLYRGHKKIISIREAIVRIGLQATRDLATSLAMKNIFHTENRLIKSSMHRIWDRSVQISALSYTIAHNVRHINAEQAMLAGLMHQIGAVPILTYIASDNMEVRPEELQHILNKLGALAGILVVRQWGIDDQYGTVIEECSTWDRDPYPQADLADVVLMAQLIYEQNPSLPALDSVPAWHKLNLGELNESMLPQTVEDAKIDIESIKQLLGGYS
jgi:HD-like signal output (HDOD) protein